ncbi:hypothetical protein [Oceanicola sp. 22II-s10i]|uniref:hypothetical protein n=1 Tax=Oceanicola sp. 22II-s10i TaxID=1317116 RepID=UPI000B522DFE|nr:hypothetical protein [Oceanicola sp. 22II-s10i]
MKQGAVRFHLDPELLASAREGRHNFLQKIQNVVERAGLEVELIPNAPATRKRAASVPGWDLFHMDPPTHDRAVTIRRVYHYPFWAIERAAERWDWDVARAEFPGAQDRAEADRFARFWRRRLFGELEVSERGHVYVPLQGKIREHRSFQACSPLDMLRSVLRREPERPVVATLHPNEFYDEKDIAALERLEQDNPRLTVAFGEMERHLPGCAYVVTQNSAAAFNGYFFGKPAVIFARIDFHHIAANVMSLGEDAAFAQVREMRPDYAGYIHWFWQIMSINAGRPEAEDRIAKTLRGHGWPV